MRKCLEKEFPTESLGLGGVFCAKKGQLKIHVMPEFSTKPLELDSDVENWLNFYTMDSNFTCFSVFVSRDPVRPKLYNHKVFLKSFISIFLSKVNSVQEPFAKCFAVHILKFEILQTT